MSAIEVIKTAKGETLLRALDASAEEWLVEYMHLLPWQKTTDGAYYTAGHAERIVDDIGAAGIVRKFIVEFDPVRIGSAGSNAA